MHFCEHHQIDGRAEEYDSMKFVFFCAAMATYNTITCAMHLDHTLTLTVAVTEKMRNEINTYFQGRPETSVH